MDARVDELLPYAEAPAGIPYIGPVSYTQLAGLSVNYVVVDHGIAYADFSRELSQLNENPSVQDLFIRITTDTLMEFADIQSVVIQINGNSMSFAHEVQNRRDNTPTMDSAS